MPGPRNQRPAALGMILITVLVLAACGAATTSGTVPPATAPAATPSAATAVESADPSAVPSAAATAVPSDGSTTGQERTDAFGIAQVWVPAGTFMMGTDAMAIAALEAQSPPDWVAPESRASSLPTR